MQARHIDAIEQKGLSVIVQVLIWGGVLLLLLGAVLVYPYVASRLSSVPPVTFHSSDQGVHRQQQRRSQQQIQQVANLHCLTPPCCCVDE